MPEARTTDPTTSHEAADSIGEATLRESQSWVLAVLAYTGPATDEKLVSDYCSLADRWDHIPPQSPSGIRTRRHELVGMGKIRDTGTRAALHSGRNATVWAVAW